MIFAAPNAWSQVKMGPPKGPLPVPLPVPLSTAVCKKCEA